LSYRPNRSLALAKMKYKTSKIKCQNKQNYFNI